jgi:tetratricopeptide (TPR) repeat protein/predicted Ser/Thr protein kinase
MTPLCPPDEQLERLLAEQLGAAEDAAVAAHVEECAACQRRLECLLAPDAGAEAPTPPPAVPVPDPGETLLGELARRGPCSVRPSAGSPGPGLREVPGYEVLEEVGRGGMGVIYRARHRGLGRTVALKMILAGADAAPDERARFRTEAEAVARLQHPNMVQVYDAGEHQGRLFLALEFIDGGSLKDALDGTPQPARSAAEVVETLARAVHHAHQRGIVHRDLKPANVLVTADGTPKVTDFGLAKLVAGPAGGAGPTRTGAVVGTPSYMAPEQAAGGGSKVGPAADVWALGAILYELLTGRPPFQATTPLDTLLQVLHDEPVPVRRPQPQVPRDLETVCHKCLHKDPARRYLSAQELADDLRYFLDGEPIRARPVSRIERLGRWCRRRAGLITAAACTLLALAVAGLFARQAHLTDQQRRTENRGHAEEKALLAAMNGDADGATRAIDEAESLGASPGRMTLLRGQVAFHRGDVDAARDHLERAVEQLPDSVAARAMLAMACYHSGHGARFEQVALEVDRMMPQTAEDFLFKGQVESITRPERAMQTLDEAIRRGDSLVARSVCLEARAELALFTDDVRVAASVLEDAQVAKAMLPGNAVTLARSVNAHLLAAGVFEVGGRPERSRAALEQAGRDARALEPFTSVPPALVARFNYADAVGDSDAALAVSRLRPTEIRLALMLYRAGDYPAALAAADRAAARGSALAWIERGFILAEIPGRGDQAFAAFQEAEAHAGPGSEGLCPPMILQLLGRSDAAEQASRKVRGDPTRVPPWYQGWYHREQAYQCGDITEDDLLQAAGTCRPKQCEARFLIGLHHLAEGDREGAREHFQKCVDTRVFVYWDYKWARAFVDRLKQDPDWPRWTTTRK